MGLSVISVVATAASTLLDFVGSVQENKARESQARFNAQVARNNSIIAERRAADARERGKIEEARQKERTRQLIGRQRAAAAAQGVVVDEGSALDITSDTAGLGELDALTIRNNAEREALGFSAQASNFRTQSQVFNSSADQIRSSTFLSTAGTLLDGASLVADKWKVFK